MISVSVYKAVVYTRDSGTDLVQLFTDNTSPYIYVGGLKDGNKLTLSFEATKGYGAEYVRSILGIEPEVMPI